MKTSGDKRKYGTHDNTSHTETIEMVWPGGHVLTKDGEDTTRKMLNRGIQVQKKRRREDPRRDGWTT